MFCLWPVFPRWDFAAFNKYAAPLGGQGTMECLVRAVPAPAFHWQDHNGVNMTSGGYTISSVGVKSTVQFFTVTQSTYGTYKCWASNIIGQSGFDVTLQEPGEFSFPDLNNWNPHF